LGMPIVFALVEHFGGLELRIPHKLKSNHMLMAMGEAHAEAICDIAQATRSTFPKP